MKAISVLFFLFGTYSLTSAGHKKSHHEDDDHVSYKFEYGVADHHTGDFKSHHEFRHGSHVGGVYTLKEADGTIRIVKYTAGPHSGFKAEVERIGLPHHQHRHLHLGKSAEADVENIDGSVLEGSKQSEEGSVEVNPVVNEKNNFEFGGEVPREDAEFVGEKKEDGHSEDRISFENSQASPVEYITRPNGFYQKWF